MICFYKNMTSLLCPKTTKTTEMRNVYSARSTMLVINSIVYHRIVRLTISYIKTVVIQTGVISNVNNAVMQSFNIRN